MSDTKRCGHPAVERPGPFLSRRSKRRGFTLVELLVVIAIIGVLVALLLPAVQAAREAARRSQCLNHLKQIGLGFQTHDSALGYFAPGWTENNVDERGDRGPNLSWGFHLLPYIEQSALHQQFNQKAQAASGTPGGPIENIDLLGQVVTAYRCPTASSPLTESITGQGNFYPAIPEYAISNYVGSGSSCEVCQTGYLPDFTATTANSELCFETDPSSTLPFTIPARRTHHNGVVYRNSNTKLKTITDGSSNTFLVGERSFEEFIDKGTGKKFFSQAYWAGIPGPSSNQLACFAGYLTAFVKYREQLKSPMINGHAYGFRSQHPGGVQAVLCDGSARFIEENVNNELVEFMVRVDDGQTVGAL